MYFWIFPPPSNIYHQDYYNFSRAIPINLYYLVPNSFRPNVGNFPRPGESWVRFFGDTDVDGSGRITFDELETAIKIGKPRAAAKVESEGWVKDNLYTMYTHDGSIWDERYIHLYMNGWFLWFACRYSIIYQSHGSYGVYNM